jgi:hypothetical protein
MQKKAKPSDGDVAPCSWYSENAKQNQSIKHGK